ncbi:putative protein serine/threonine kinase [Cavenderia fasciculata]|uniref:Pleckstrin domain-containing protein n=1 Tax=Cavenderia fasciculata TaxID=261658 RepID=F4Q9H0_CACFS|nr:putative protein serine/threonine kinase [Cavenderia fasciculata]EGG15339.1 putative protein serine/threonine kinase [Cavenderia fasciculata]|eukprot:XP_004352059.1 putative protein serine/threonine kinase [Cavenderia fasciculata]
MISFKNNNNNHSNPKPNGSSSSSSSIKQLFTAPIIGKTNNKNNNTKPTTITTTITKNDPITTIPNSNTNTNTNPNPNPNPNRSSLPSSSSPIPNTNYVVNNQQIYRNSTNSYQLNQKPTTTITTTTSTTTNQPTTTTTTTPSSSSDLSTNVNVHNRSQSQIVDLRNLLVDIMSDPHQAKYFTYAGSITEETDPMPVSRPSLKALLTFFEDARERQGSLSNMGASSSSVKTPPPPLPPRPASFSNRASVNSPDTMTDFSEAADLLLQQQHQQHQQHDNPTEKTATEAGITKSPSSASIVNDNASSYSEQYTQSTGTNTKNQARSTVVFEDLKKELFLEKYSHDQLKLLVKSLQEDNRKLSLELTAWKQKYGKLSNKMENVRLSFNQLAFAMTDTSTDDLVSSKPGSTNNNSSSQLSVGSGGGVDIKGSPKIAPSSPAVQERPRAVTLGKKDLPQTKSVVSINIPNSPNPTTSFISTSAAAAAAATPVVQVTATPSNNSTSSPLSNNNSVNNNNNTNNNNNNNSNINTHSGSSINVTVSNGGVNTTTSATPVLTTTNSLNAIQQPSHKRRGSSNSVTTTTQLSGSYGIEMDFTQNLTEEEYITMIESRRITAHNILKSEKEYLAYLHLIIDEFLTPLSAESYHSANPFISAAQVKQVFSEIQVIRGSSNLLIEDLEKLLSETSNVGLGEAFLKLCDYFKLYSPYVTNYYTSLSVLNKLKEDSHRFQTFIQEKEKGLDSSFSGLGSLLLLPLNRIGQYTISLTDLWKSTPVSHPDFTYFRDAVTKMKSILESVKEKTREYDSQNKVRFIQEHLIQNKDSKYSNLNEPHRRYVKEGLLTESTKGTPQQLYVFLFNDLMVVSVQKKTQFMCKRIIRLIDSEVTIVSDAVLEDKPLFQITFTVNESEPVGQTSTNNVLNGIINGISSASSAVANAASDSGSRDEIKDSYTFCVESIRDRDDWVNSIQNHIAIERKKAGNRRPDETSWTAQRGAIDFQSSEIKLCEPIGSGGSGCTVNRCTVDGLTCAVKVLKLKNTQTYLIDQFVGEISIMEQLSHQNIAKYLGHRLTNNPDPRLWLFMEYYPFSLKDIIANRTSPFPYADAIWMALEIGKGLEFLHTQKPSPIIHRDLKPGNIMCSMDENNRVSNVRVCDFDTSKVLASGVTLKTCIGSPIYMAPEVLDINTTEDTDGYTIKADIWSYAMLVFEIVTLRTPYHQFSHLQAIEMILKGTPPPILNNTLPPSFQPLLEIVYSCLDLDPKKRPSAAKLCERLGKILKIAQI